MIPQILRAHDGPKENPLVKTLRKCVRKRRKNSEGKKRTALEELLP